MSALAKVLTLSDRKRAAILEAAYQCFRKEGFHDTTMDRVAERAGVSKRTVYNHFPSKDVLFDVVIANGWSRLAPLAEQPPDRNTTVEKRLTALARRRIDVIVEPGIIALFRMVLAESVRAPELMRAYASPRGLGDLLGLPDILQEEVRRGRLRIDHIELAATQFWGLTLGSLFWPLVMGLRGTPDETERQIVIAEAIRVFLARYGARPKRPTVRRK